MKITLKDGSFKEYEGSMSVLDITKDISEGLARVACAGEVDGELVDLRTVVDKDCNLNILTFESEGGALAADAAVQQSPEAFVPEFREIGHSILRRRDSRALRGCYSGRYFLLNSVPAFHGSCSR